MNRFLKIGLGLMLFGFVGMALISLISLALYGRIYMYDGYDYTGTLWTICFVSVGFGFLTLIPAAFSRLHIIKKAAPIIMLVLMIIVLIVIIVFVFKSCGSLLGSSGGSTSSDKCGACGGSGLVNNGFWDWRTCPYCKGAGVPLL